MARAGDATYATSGWELCQHIDGRCEAGNHSCSGMLVIILNAGADLIKSPQCLNGSADAPLRGQGTVADFEAGTSSVNVIEFRNTSFQQFH